MPKKSRRSSPARKRKKSRKQGGMARIRGIAVKLFLTSLVLFISYAIYLDVRVTQSFEGKRWSLPARVFARPLELYEGRPLNQQDLLRDLKLLRYQETGAVRRQGTYTRKGQHYLISSRDFLYPDGEEPGSLLSLKIQSGRVVALQSDGKPVNGLVRLDPLLIANIYPAHREDRVLLRLDQVPPMLLEALMAVEDRGFYGHHGVAPTAIARALLANLSAGRAVQGGSTLTQQLVKNYFLTPERSLWRKFNEAIMSVLLEFHYEKDEILEAYINEIYLGQSGRQAIHGFGLASQFYFNRHLAELQPEQLALLVGLVKGPSYYNPRKHPERIRQRRDLVLEIMADAEIINTENLAAYQSRPLGVTKNKPGSETPFPAFLDLVKEQLHRDYSEEDLRSEGLLIFSTLDPILQVSTEQAVTNRLRSLESVSEKRKGLEAAAIVTSVGNGEVLALVGGRDPRYAGFNRVLNARRPIGSLIKPVVMLAALDAGQATTLATLLEDSPFVLAQPNGDEWRPRNYDGEAHGKVIAADALIHSYNLATARLGLETGVEKVTTKLAHLGGKRDVRSYPSVLLGAVEMTPFEVARVYQTLATEGYRMPLRGIRAVMDAQGNVLSQYDLEVRQVADERHVYQVSYVLNQVTKRGTASRLSSQLNSPVDVAGKTGTTNDLRDSWFAGYSADHMAVVWVGRDDNSPAGLSGSSGALPIWGDIFNRLSTQSLLLDPPAGVELAWIDPANGLLADPACENALQLPFVTDTVPQVASACSPGLEGTVKKSWNWLQKLLNTE